MNTSLFCLIIAIFDFVLGAIYWTQYENPLLSIVWVILGIMQLIMAAYTKS